MERPKQSAWQSERRGGEGIRGDWRGPNGDMIKKRSMGHWWRGRGVEAEPVRLGERAEGRVECEEVGKRGPVQHACFANIICMEPMQMEFCVTIICIHLHKINPPPNLHSDCF